MAKRLYQRGTFSVPKGTDAAFTLNFGQFWAAS